jgi:hypothetical protein
MPYRQNIKTHFLAGWAIHPGETPTLPQNKTAKSQLIASNKKPQKNLGLVLLCKRLMAVFLK